MARLIRVEECKNCPNVSRLTDWDSPHVTFSCSLRRDARGGYMEVPDPWAIPDWCPLPEADDGRWVPVEEALPEPDTMVEVILVANLEHFDERVPESHWIDVHARWIATRRDEPEDSRWDAPQCGRDPGGWKLVDRLGERWDVVAVVAWRELPPLGREWEERMAEDSRIVGEICGWGREPDEVSDGATTTD